MADPTIKIKRSAVEGKIPTADQVPLGEIALNTYDGKLFASKNVGIGTTVFAVNPWTVGTGTNTYNTYFTAGNVGIGTDNPQSKLDVRGTISIGRTDGVGINSIRSVVDINSWEYSGTNFSVGSQDTSPQDLFFKSDGTKMYIVGSSNDNVYEYTLSSAWDVSSATLSYTFDISGQETTPYGLYFKPDGTRMYISGGTGVSPTGDYVRSYTLSTAWDLSTASYDSIVFNHGSQDTAPTGVYLKDDGTKMFTVGSTNDRVYQFDLGTTWDVSSATFDDFFSLTSFSPTISGPQGIDFNSDGTKMYIIGSSRDVIARFNLSTPWDITTASYFDNFYVGFQELASTGVFYEEGQNKAWICGTSGVSPTGDRVYQYNTNVPSLEIASSPVTTESSVIINNELRLNNELYVTDSIDTNGNLRVNGTINAAGTINAVTLNITSAIDLADADILRFGSSDDVKVFYDGTANDLEIELEAAATQIAITDNGTYKHIITKDGKVGINTPTTPTSELEVYGDAYVSGTVTATTFSGSGASLTSIPNAALDNSTVSYGGVQLSLGGSDATPAFDLTDATNYPYTSLTGITTDIVGDTTPQLGGNLDLNSNNITGTGNIDITGTLNVSGVSTFQSNVYLGDNDSLYFGDGRDLQIYHDGSNSYIKDAGTGDLYIHGGPTVRIGQPTYDSASFNTFGPVELYYDTSKKFETTSGGITVTGTVTADGLRLGDSDYAMFGVGNDLQIYHDATVNHIKSLDKDLNIELEPDGGNPKLYIRPTTSTQGITLGGGGENPVEIYHNNSKKFETTGIGVSIIGVGNTATITGPSNLVLDPGTVGDNTGTVTILGNLQVDGTQTIINSTTLEVDDKLVSIAKSATNATQADGAGLEINGASATLTYASTGDKWVFNKAPYYNTDRLLTTADEGTGNGIDADTVDGLEASSFLRSDAADTGTGLITLTNGLNVTGGSVGINSTAPTEKLDVIGTVKATLFSGSGASLTSIPNAALDNSTVSYGGVQLSLGGSDATPAFDLTDATNYPYTSLTGITTDIVGDTTPQLGGNLDLNSNNITGTGNIDITGTLNVSGVSTFQSDIHLGDNDKIRLGDLPDMEIFHDGSNSIIDDIGQGSLVLRSDTSIALRKRTGDENQLVANPDGSVELYYDAVKKFETTNTGITVTGNVTADGLRLGDSEYAYFGDANDLRIYHDGTDNHILSPDKDLNIELYPDVSNPKLYIRPTTSTQGITLGGGGENPVEIYHNNSKKFETVGTGVTVIGDVYISGGISVGNTTGTSGQVLQSTGTGLQWATSSGGGGESYWASTSVGIHTLSNVGIGTTNPTSKLTVSGDAYVTGIITATTFSGSGTNLTGIVTSITAGSGISVDQSTGNVTITATGGGGGGDIVTRTVSSTTATGGQTTFNRTYDVGYIDVYLNGTRLDSSEFTASNGTTVVLNTGATANDVIETVSYESVGITSVTVLNDSSPQLGGDLDLNSYNITGTGNINITGIATVTGGQLATQADAIAYAIALG